MPALLTIGSRIQCPHGGQAVLATSNAAVSSSTGMVLLETDIHPVVGCPFTIGPKYSPCVRIEWKAGTTMASVGGVAALIATSIGTCYSPESAPQGIAIIVSPEPKGTAT